MPRKTQQEKRKFVRAKRILSIRHRLHKRGSKAEDGTWHRSTTEDMSASGLLFVTKVPYQLNDLIEMQVVMAGALDIFNGYGKIVRVSKNELGVVYMVGVEYQNVKSRSKGRKAKSFSRA